MPTQTFADVMETLYLRIRAGYPVIYVVSHEENRVLECLARIARVLRKDRPKKRLLRWTAGIGLEQCDRLEPASRTSGGSDWLEVAGLAGAQWKTYQELDPVKALRLLREAGEKEYGGAEIAESLTVFFDVHSLLQRDTSAPLVRPLRATAAALRRHYSKEAYKTVVIVAPTASGLAPELEGDITVVEFPLPEAGELRRSLRRMVDRKTLTVPDEVPAEDLERILDEAPGAAERQRERYIEGLCELVAGAGRGLRLQDYELCLNAFAVRDPVLGPSHIDLMLKEKAEAVRRSPALEFTPNVEVELGGLDDIQAWIDVRRGVAGSEDVRRRWSLPAPKGVLLCGVAGGGKSQLAKHLAKRFDLALLRLDVGALFGSYIGESERQTREALQLAEALAPVVLWLDEIDKGFAGAGKSSGDGGVSARVFGHFLTWLAEKKDTVFVVATANNFEELLERFPEFGRKGRFDEVFWIGLPDTAARRQIFEIYLEPHRRRLQIAAGELDAIAAAQHVPELGVEEPDDYSRLVRILSDELFSDNLTGAEIEAAVGNMLYAAYDEDRRANRTEPSQISATLVARQVVLAKDRALYKRRAEKFELLTRLEHKAASAGWIGAAQQADFDRSEDGARAADGL